MKEIWAPWRIEYIKKAHEKGCFLCKSFKSRNDRKNLVVRRGKTCALVINRYPYNSGHLMVAPLRHAASLEHLKPAETAEITRMTIAAIHALKKTMQPQGFNVGINIGEAAGAGLKDHIHVHIVPRWTGDTNFMPVLADVRVMPQALREIWSMLRKALRSA